MRDGVRRKMEGERQAETKTKREEERYREE